MRNSVILIACLLLAAVLIVFIFSRRSSLEESQVAHPHGSQSSLPTPPIPDDGVAIRFDEVAKQAGIDFAHSDGRSAMHYLPEVMGGGVAWLDFDQDGYLDLFFVQGGPFSPDSIRSSKLPSSRLYRNQGDGSFVDVTEKVGLQQAGYGQGVAVGDYDNDGYPDLFVTCFGGCHLYHNESNGASGRRFRDVTAEAGIHLDGWCSSCAFGDLHGRGFLDLFVCRYLSLDFKDYPFCGDRTKDPPRRRECGPREFHGTRSVLLRNNGNGTFTDVTVEAGIEPEGKGLGVVILDLDGDGRSDIFVGNDEMPNFQYLNLGNGKFKSCSITSGTATNWQGHPMGSMGVEANDLTGHGRPDIFVSTFFQQGWTLYRNDGNNLFTDVSPKAGMRTASWDKVGWGTCLLDCLNKGDLDIFVANGHIFRDAAELLERNLDGSPQSYEQTAQLFKGDGLGHFLDVSKQAGPYFLQPHAGRGAAMGDYDNDGAMDIAVNHCGAPAALLHNTTRSTNHWIRLELQGNRNVNDKGSNRDAVGARVIVKVAGRTLVRHVKGGGSYLSAHDRRLLVGLGSAEKVDDVEVRWPNAGASVQHFGPLAADKSYKLVEGASKAAPALCPRVPSR
jgi:hypothetical protein